MKHRTYMIPSVLAALTLLAVCTGCGSKTGESEAEESVTTAAAEDSESAETTAAAADESEGAEDSASEDSAADPDKEQKDSKDKEQNQDSESDTEQDASGNAENNGDTPSAQNDTPAGTSAGDNHSGNDGGRQSTTAAQADQQGGNAQQQDDSYAVGSSPTVGIGSITAKAGDKGVKVPVMFWNNPGYATSGIKINYDPALTLSRKEDDPDNLKYENGPAAEGLMGMVSCNEARNLVGFASFGNGNCTASGAIFYFYVDIPENAQPGTVYLFTVEVDSLASADGTNVQTINAETVGGEIRIEG